MSSSLWESINESIDCGKQIKIEILDVNDNAPEFPQRRMRHRIAESTDPESSGIAVPSATDPDSGRNAIHKYEIYSTTDQFLLDARQTADGGTDLRLLLREPLDREHEDRYQVAVVALDGGNPPKSGSILVDISVADINDNAPVFDNDTYEVHVPEDVTPGTAVARVRARDRDLGLNGAIVYAFSPLTDAQHGAVFGIKSDTGKIYIKDAGLDHERASVHLLSVIGADKGAVPLTSHTTVVIRVDDVNDNSPSIAVNTLTPHDVATVAENSESGTFVAYANVNDPDSGDNGRFSCAVTSSSERFALRQTFPPGEFQLVTASAPLDREQRAGYDVTIACADAGSDEIRTSQAIVHVIVADVNDNAPKFSRDVYEFEVIENCAQGTSVGRVTATDADEGANGQVQYRLQGLPRIPGRLPLLHIDAASGLITTRGEVDRESLPPLVRGGEPLELIATAIDGGSEVSSVHFTATALVRLIVLDMDDREPVFESDLYVFHIAENEPAGTVLGHVKARDPDLPPHDVVRYHAVRHGDVDTSSLFRVYSQTGTIASRETFDRERQASYHFDVVASGGGLSMFSARTCVDVQVVDINDHRPLFTEPLWDNRTLLISSQTPRGHVISWLRAVDLDEGRNARLTFIISDGNRRNVFALHPVSGALSVAADLSGIILEEFALHVTVQDGGLPVALRDDSMLRIAVNRDVAFVPPPSGVNNAGSSLDRFGVLASETTAIVLSIALSIIVTIIIIIAVCIFCVLQRRGRFRRAQRSGDHIDDDKRQHPEVLKLNHITPETRLCNRVELFPSAADGTAGGHGSVKCNGTARSTMANGGVSPYFAPTGYSGSVTSSFTHPSGSEAMNYYQVSLCSNAAPTDCSTPSERCRTSNSHSLVAPSANVSSYTVTSSPGSVHHLRTSSADLPAGLAAIRYEAEVPSEGVENGDAAESTLSSQRRSGVVVFVKDHQDQLQQHLQPRRQRMTTCSELTPDSASNTDSGNGTSEYSDDPSPPLIFNSPAAAAAAATATAQRRHNADDLPSCIYAAGVGVTRRSSVQGGGPLASYKKDYQTLPSQRCRVAQPLKHSLNQRQLVAHAVSIDRNATGNAYNDRSTSNTQYTFDSDSCAKSRFGERLSFAASDVDLMSCTNQTNSSRWKNPTSVTDLSFAYDDDDECGQPTSICVGNLITDCRSLQELPDTNL